MRTLTATTELIDEALGAVCRTDGQLWTAISRLSSQPDAPGLLAERYRAATSAELRWALVFVAANLGKRAAAPILIEASVRSDPGDEIYVSAARIASESLVNLVSER